MKFNIRDIGPEGLQVRRKLTDPQVRELADGGVELGPGLAELELDLHLSQAEAAPAVILARGALGTRFEVSCSRCLGPATIKAASDDTRFTFLPEAPRVARSEEELTAEDLDTFTYDGEEIDLAPMLREFMILAVPMAPVCAEDCKGICSGCGAELNREPCRCAGTESQSRWAAALRDLQKKTS